MITSPTPARMAATILRNPRRASVRGTTALKPDTQIADKLYEAVCNPQFSASSFEAILKSHPQYEIDDSLMYDVKNSDNAFYIFEKIAQDRDHKKLQLLFQYAPETTGEVVRNGISLKKDGKRLYPLMHYLRDSQGKFEHGKMSSVIRDYAPEAYCEYFRSNPQLSSGLGYSFLTENQIKIPLSLLNGHTELYPVMDKLDRIDKKLDAIAQRLDIMGA